MKDLRNHYKFKDIIKRKKNIKKKIIKNYPDRLNILN